MRTIRETITGSRYRLPLIAWIILCLGVAYALGFYAYTSDEKRQTTGDNNHPPSAVHRPSPTFDLFWEAYAILRNEFYGDLPDGRQLAYGALRGALSTLKDPYSVFVEPQPHEIEKADLQGSFGGIGVNLSRDARDQVILHPLPDSPAARAGVQDGDILLAIDGVPLTPTLHLDAIVIWLRGPVGEPVTLTLQTAETAPPSVVRRPSSVIIIRAEIELPSVAWRQLDSDPRVGYIAISRFSERTHGELRRALDDLRNRGVQRLILDLRNNGGGLLQAAIDVTGEFINDQVILYEQRRGKPEEARRSSSAGSAADLPLVVLVNRGTASASEIVAGALQDYGRARLIGEPTFGKGSVQLIFELSDGSSLHVTAARWLTPRRRQLDGVGLTPDILQEGEVQIADMATIPADVQFVRAVSYLQTTDGQPP